MTEMNLEIIFEKRLGGLKNLSWLRGEKLGERKNAPVPGKKGRYLLII
jgi:hypothetical protein